MTPSSKRLLTKRTVGRLRCPVVMRDACQTQTVILSVVEGYL